MKMTKVVSSVNQKGGVGKSTILCNLGYYLAEKGKKVLFLDIDLQENLTELLLPDFAACSDANALEFVENGIPFGSAALYSENAPLNVVPCSPCRVGQRTFYEGQLFILPSHKASLADVSDGNAIEIAHRRFEELLNMDFDYILIDCPPAPGVHQITPIALSDEVICPIELDAFSMKGLVEVWKMITQIRELNMKEEGKPALHVVANKLFMQSAETKKSLDEVRSQLGDVLLDSYIANSSVIKDAVTQGRPVFKLAPNGNAATVGKKYAIVLDELVTRFNGGKA